MKQSNYRVLVKLLFIFVVYSQCFSREWKTIEYVTPYYKRANETDKYIIHHGYYGLQFNNKDEDINNNNTILYPEGYFFAEGGSIFQNNSSVVMLFDPIPEEKNYSYKVFKIDIENNRVNEIGYEFKRLNLYNDYPILLKDGSILLINQDENINWGYTKIIKFNNPKNIKDSLIIFTDDRVLFSYYFDKDEELLYICDDLGLNGLLTASANKNEVKSLSNEIKKKNPENELVNLQKYRYCFSKGDSLFIFGNKNSNLDTSLKAHLMLTIVNKKTLAVVSNQTISNVIDHDETNISYLHKGNFIVLLDIFNNRFIWSNDLGKSWSNFETLPDGVVAGVVGSYESFLSSNGVLFIFNSRKENGIYGTENYYTRLSPSSSIYEQDDDISMLFPNPAPDYINIVGVGRYEIYSMIGEKISTGESFNGKLNVTELPKGIYFVSINGKVSKFVKE